MPARAPQSNRSRFHHRATSELRSGVGRLRYGRRRASDQVAARSSRCPSPLRQCGQRCEITTAGIAIGREAIRRRARCSLLAPSGPDRACSVGPPLPTSAVGTRPGGDLNRKAEQDLAAARPRWSTKPSSPRRAHRPASRRLGRQLDRVREGPRGASGTRCWSTAGKTELLRR